MAEKKITLTVGAEDFDFNVTSDVYNRFINETTAIDKVRPAKQFLRRSLVNKDQRDALDDLCDRGLAMQMTAELVKDFSGDIEIEIKK